MMKFSRAVNCRDAQPAPSQLTDSWQLLRMNSFTRFANDLRHQHLTKTRTDGCSEGRTELWLRNKLAPALPFHLALPIISLILNSTVIWAPHGTPGQAHGPGCCFTGWAACQRCSTYFPGPLGQLQATTPVFTLLLWTAKLLLTIEQGPIYSYFSLVQQQHYLTSPLVGYNQLLAAIGNKQKEKRQSRFKQRATFSLKKVYFQPQHLFWLALCPTSRWEEGEQRAACEAECSHEIGDAWPS